MIPRQKIWRFVCWLATEPGWKGRALLMGAGLAIVDIPFGWMLPVALGYSMIDTALFPKEDRSGDDFY